MASFARLCCLTFGLSSVWTHPSLGKGLDSLQAETPSEATPPDAAGSAASPTPAPAVAAPPLPTPPSTPPPPAGAVDATKATTPIKVTAPVPPGLQKIYISSSLSWLNLTGSKGGWHSGTTGDVEIGHKIRQLNDKIDLFGTFRYRPVVVDVVLDMRAYRAVVESYLFGAKSHYPINPKLTAFASAELGLVQTHAASVDSQSEIDKDLEKSGVDLALGAGVSYLVLDKLGVGSRLALGTGTYKTLQLGLDVRFLF